MHRNIQSLFVIPDRLTNIAYKMASLRLHSSVRFPARIYNIWFRGDAWDIDPVTMSQFTTIEEKHK